MNNVAFEGSLTALLTPFTPDAIDERAFADLVDWQIRSGTNGIVPCSVIGEGPTLSDHERERLVRIAVEVAAGRVPVVAATGHNATSRTIAMSIAAEQAGADAILVAVPYYNRPSQAGIVRHFAAVAAAVEIPLLVADEPDRSAVSLARDTILELQATSGISGLVTSAMPMPALSVPWLLLSGADRSAVADHLGGSSGRISSIANIYPGAMAGIEEACRRGEYELASVLDRQLQPILSAVACEPEPVAIKYAVSRLLPGFDPAPRLPLVLPSPASIKRIDAAMEALSDAPESFARHIGAICHPRQRCSL